MYMHVYACICMYMYVLYVHACICIYMNVYASIWMYTGVLVSILQYKSERTLFFAKYERYVYVCIACICQYIVSICTYMHVHALISFFGDDILAMFLIILQILVAKHCSDWNQTCVSPESWTCPVCRATLSHPWEISLSSSWGRRHQSLEHAWPQGCVLSAWRVRPSGLPRLRKPPVLHQLLGHDLASGLQDGWEINNNFFLPE